MSPVAGARLLVVDDDPGIVAMLSGIFTRAGYQVSSTTDPRAAATLYSAHDSDAVLLDVSMPEHDGFAVLDEIRTIDPDACVLMLTGHGDIESAVRAMRAGAENFLTKPFDREHLLITVERALEQTELRRRHRLRSAQVRADEQTAELVLSRPVVRLLQILARKRSPLLLHGERGTGRRLAATLLHRLSDRADQPLLQLSVKDRHEADVRRLLFGGDGTPGLVRLAQRGTLVLRDVEALTPALQDGLVRVFGERDGSEADRPDGGWSAPARLIAISAMSPAQAAASGALTRAFIHLFGALPVQLPPLRDRDRDTIEALAAHTVRAGFIASGTGPEGLAPDALDVLVAQRWPGNLTELEEIVSAALVHGAHADTLTAAHVHAALGDAALPNDAALAAPFDALRGRAATSPAGGVATVTPTSLRTLVEVEREHVAAVMHAVRGNVSEAARVLGITRTTLYKKLRGLDQPD